MRISHHTVEEPARPQGRDHRERGASLVEYALLVALIAVVCIVAVTFLGKSASSKFDATGSGIANGNTCPSGYGQDGFYDDGSPACYRLVP